MKVPNKSKQWTTAQDGLEKLKLGDVDVPAPKDGQVLVKIHAVSLNYRDTEGMLRFCLFSHQNRSRPSVLLLLS